MLSPVFSPDAAAPAQERGSLEEPVRPYSDNLGAAADEFAFGGGSAAASQDDEEGFDFGGQSVAAGRDEGAQGEDGSAFGDGGEDYGAAATQGGWDDFGGVDGSSLSEEDLRERFPSPVFGTGPGEYATLEEYEAAKKNKPK